MPGKRRRGKRAPKREGAPRPRRARRSGYQPDFQRTIGSFAPLTDPAVLKVQPNRLQIMTIKESLTVTEFNRRFPSRIEPDELALINGMPSAAAVLPAGSRVKRVVAQ